MDIFSYMYPAFKFKEKRVRLFEAFAGTGTQAMALKRLGVEVEHIGISEIDKYAIQAHRAIHGEVKNYGGIGDFEKLPPNIDICTWSFPCQDISMAGQQKGMDEGTRSNYGYVFLDTVEKMNKEERPKILLMENVEALVSSKFERNWEEIHIRLERMGYQSYSKVLEATDYGVPQTRRRIFVVSILGNYSYTFPKPIPLTKTLKDFLENEVDLNYYLSQKQINQILNWKAYQKPIDNAKTRDSEYVQTITAKSNTSMNSSMVLIKERLKEGKLIAERRRDEGIRLFKGDYVGTLRTKDAGGDKIVLENLNIPKKEQFVNEIVDRGLVKEGDMLVHSYSNNRMKDIENYKPESTNGIAPTFTTRVDTLGVVVDEEVTLAVRKLTPLEAWRLMGIDDEDFYKAKSSGLSDNQLYKIAGNAIVVDVLEHIFKELF